MKIKSVLNKIIYIVLSFTMMISLCACSSDNTNEKKQNGNYIYYVDDEKLTLASEEYVIKSNQTQDKVDEIVKEVTKKTLPKNIILNSTNLLDGILTLDLGTEYSKLDKEKEVLLRAAIVLTFTQIESVDYVAITINDNPLQRSDGSLVGNMQSIDFVDGYGNENIIAYSTKFVLYYASEDGTTLKEYDLIDDYSGEQSKEEFIVRKMVEGPDKEGYSGVLSPETDIISVMTTDNICYVNFGDNFLTEQTVISPNFVIYSIVNSLSELNYVHKVQISVNGVSTISYNGVSLENAFIRNLDYVASKETNESIKGE